MEAGDYARMNCTVYDTVVINRIAEIFDNTILTENDGSMYQGEYSKEEIIKSSPNIIDILEVGDYVNGLKAIQMYSPEGKYTLWIKLSDNTFIDNSEEIKSIATKEQFKNIEYEVK